MNGFWREWTTGDLTARDELQLELKSDIFIQSYEEDTVFKQEFFIFIPSSLQVNKNSYSKEQFYRDETNLIRYKTPILTFQEILHSRKSPLNKISQIYSMPNIYKTTPGLIYDEIRLFGNIFRSALRNRTYDLLLEIEFHSNHKKLILELEHMLRELNEIVAEFRNMRVEFDQKQDVNLQFHFSCVDEFLCYTVQDYLTILLKHIRDIGSKELSKVDQQISLVIANEKQYQTQHFAPVKEEIVLHRQSLLNKFVLESLLLKSNRIALEEEYKHYVGSLAAGIAMLIYMILFAWKSSEFVINSTPFIVLGVMLYVLKDRLKEWLKTLYTRQAFKWFPDYKTQILDWDEHVIGQLTESFAFISKTKVPQEFMDKFRSEWKKELKESDFQDGVIAYKREVTLYPNRRTKKARRSELNTFFRLNIHQILQKASDPVHSFLELNADTHEIQVKHLPKIYYLYVIMHQYYDGAEGIRNEEVKNFRVVVNKKGIKRVELIN